MLDKLMQKVGRFLPPLFFTLTIIGVFVASPALQAQAQSWVNGFVRDVNGLLMVDCSNCTAGSGVQTVTAANSSITVAGTVTNPTVNLNVNNVNGFTAAQQFLGAGSCASVPTTVFGACFGSGNGATNIIGAAFGPSGVSGWGCSASCTTSSSTQACFYGESSTGPLSQCLSVDSTGVMNVSKFKITNSFDMGANPVKNANKYGTYAACSGSGSFTGTANNSAACALTLVSGASTWTFGTAYAAAPICSVDAVNDTNVVYIASGYPTASAVKIQSASGTDTAVVDVICMGNGGV